MRSQRSALAVGALMGSLEHSGSSAAAGQAFQLKDVVLTQSLRVMDSVLKEYVSSIAFAALDSHLQSLTDDPQALSRARIKLPSVAGLSARQQQRIVTMAAIVIAPASPGRC